MYDVLIIGGAGYIGSHFSKYFIEKKVRIVIIDNLSTGHRDSINEVPFYKIDIRNENSLRKVFLEHKIDAVMHFAASSIVPESIKIPYEYYHNNVFGMMSLLKVMYENSVNKIVFSSTAAVYGDPVNIPILETDPTKPTNPYGETKLAMEKMMHWFEQAYNIKYVSLRYFNAAGASNDGSIGERHDPETHLIPIVLHTALGMLESVKIFGTDYPTPDGTCVRDYIHVEDLAEAHELALNYLSQEKRSNIFNLGNGLGYSVKEVIGTVKQVTGIDFPVEEAERRHGDPAILIASSEKARKELGWVPKKRDLQTIVEYAWRFAQKNYGKK